MTRLKVLLLVAGMMTLTLSAPAKADNPPTGDCGVYENNSGQITSIVDNGGGLITAQGWMRYCHRDGAWESVGLPAFGAYRLLGDGSTDAYIPAGSGQGVQTGYREFTSTFTIRRGTTDICLQMADLSTHCWTAMFYGPNDKQLNLFGHLSSDPDPGCGNCWGGGETGIKPA